jgi:hypothetical protein
MKAKFNSPIKIFSSIETKQFLATIIFTTIAITLYNFLKPTDKNQN